MNLKTPFVTNLKLFFRLQETECGPGVERIGDPLDLWEPFSQGELVRVAVRRGNTVHVTYCYPWDVRFLMDAYGS